MNQAIFAGGCFWGMEELFRALPGVVDTQVGYTGGRNDAPTYQNHPGHAEALKITFDPSMTTYRELLDYFFRFHDPTTKNRQGNDVGDSYRSAIFYVDEQQKNEAESFVDLVNTSGRWPRRVVTTLEPFTKFFLAEDYHQDYLQKNPDGYTCHYSRGGSYLT